MRPDRLLPWQLLTGMCLTVFCSVSAAETIGTSEGAVAYKPTNSVSEVAMAKSQAIKAASKNMKAFCEWNRMDRLATGLAPEELDRYRRAKTEGMSQAEDVIIERETKWLEMMRSKGYPDPINDPWKRSLRGTARLKESDASSFLYTGTSGTKKATAAEILKAFSKPFPKSTKFQAPVYQEWPGNIKPASSEKIQSCMYFSVLNSVTCAGNLTSLEQFLTKHIPEHQLNTPTVGVPVLKKVLTDPSYAEGLRRATVKVYERLTSGQSDPGANIFDDVQAGFTEAGLSQQEATEKTWDTMMLLAIGGPNFSPRTDVESQFLGKLQKGTTNLNAISLQALAEAVPNMDSMKMKMEPASLYSLPKGVKFGCDSGKGYYFWMTAYLTRMLIKEGSSPEAARIAVFNTHLGYHLGGGGGQRGPEQLLGAARFGSVENGVRMDVTLATAGTQFGADHYAGVIKKYDLNKTYLDLLESGGTTPTSDRSGVKNLFLNDRKSFMFSWLDNIAPKSIFNSFAK